MALQRIKGLTGILAGAALIGAVVACGSDHHTVSGPQAIQYTLASIDSNPLPYQIAVSGDGSVKTVMNDMVLSIFEDKTWHSVGHETVTTNGAPAAQLVQNSGSYVPGDEVTTFRDAGGNIVWTGLVTEFADSLTAANGQVWVFQR